MDYADGTTITGPFLTRLLRKTPECKAFVNPYKEGEANGQVEIFYGDGGYYKGMVENGRVSGQGDYQSAMNEVVSGTFIDGVLHGPKGFVENQIGEVYMGQYCHGELHGKGSYQNKRGDYYEGYWQHNLRHGRGVSYMLRSGCYRGFYLNNIKHGKGSLEFGYSKNRALGKMNTTAESATDKTSAKNTTTSTENNNNNENNNSTDSNKNSSSTSSSHTKSNNSNNTNTTKDNNNKNKEKINKKEEDIELNKELSEFNNMYQGYFYGNNISNKGSIMNTKLQIPNIISRLDTRATYNLNKVLKRENRLNKTASQQVEKLNDIECHLRDEIQKKKIKIFNQQKHFAKKTMYTADVDGLGQGAKHIYESKIYLRKERLNNLRDENHHFKKAMVPRLRIPNNTTNELLHKAFSHIRPERDEVEVEDKVDEKLLRILLSDFEEVQERQRFLKYDRIWQRAEDAYKGNRSAAV